MQALTLNGVQIAFSDVGDGDAVVLLGGSGMPSSVWDFSIRPAVVSAGFRAISIDSRGTGGSDSPPPPYSIPDMAQDTVGVIEQLGLGPCHLVGLSMGGLVAEQVCYARPHLIRTGTFIASAGRTTAYMRAKLEAEAKLVATTGGIPPSYTEIDALTVTLPPKVLQDDDATVELWRELLAGNLEPAGDNGLLGQAAATREWLLDESRIDRWRALSMPCQVIAFEHDLQFPPSRGPEAAGLLGDGRFVEIAGVAHGNGPFEAADEIGRAIAGFLGSLQT